MINKKIFSKNSIKYLALITMLIDHIGYTFYSIIPTWLYYLFRIIGRISFPIFSFFIAEGYSYTKNKKRYFFTLLTFAIISQIPYFLLFQNNDIISLNILITYLLSIILIYIYDKFFINKNLTSRIYFISLITITLLLMQIFLYFTINISYGTYGILLPFLFYIFKTNRKLQGLSFSILLLTHILINLAIDTINTNFILIQVFALTAIPILLYYDETKYKKSRYQKYLFYIFYPLHIIILFIIKLFI